MGSAAGLAAVAMAVEMAVAVREVERVEGATVAVRKAVVMAVADSAAGLAAVVMAMVMAVEMAVEVREVERVAVAKDVGTVKAMAVTEGAMAV